MSKNSLILVLQNKQENPTIDMAKLLINSEKSQIFYKKYSYSVRFSPYIILLSCEMQLTLVF